MTDKITMVQPPKGAQKVNKFLALVERDGLVCFYCEHELVDPKRYPEGLWRATLDHLLPRSLGGSDDLSNLVLACAPCNVRKGDHVLLPVEVIQRLRGSTEKAWGEVTNTHRYIELYIELGQRTCANLRAENAGPAHNRTAAIVKRGKATQRPRRNIFHVHGGNQRDPRGVW